MGKRRRGTKQLPLVDTLNRKGARSMAKRRKSKQSLLEYRQEETKAMAETRINKPLPLDIIHQILVCLPVQTLTKLRLICKPWDSLISCPRFQDDHFLRQRLNRLVIQVETDDGDRYISTYSKDGLTSLPKIKKRRKKEDFQLTLVKTFSIPDNDYVTRYYSIQSCLGLVCVASEFCSINLVRNPTIIFVCNPTTGKRQVLPPTSGPNMCIGFGYAATIKEFKVVRFYNSNEGSHCNVFTLGTGRWREASSPTFEDLRVCLGIAPFIHGALHFLRRTFTGDEFSITAFDIETEEYKQIPAPKYYSTALSIFQRIGLLSELGGSLCLIGKSRNILELWLLKDYKSGQWVKEYKIDLVLASRHSTEICRATPLEILGNGCIVMSLYGIGWNELICYNPVEKVTTQMEEVCKDCSWGLFEESFRSLEGT